MSNCAHSLPDVTHKALISIDKLPIATSSQNYILAAYMPRRARHISRQALDVKIFELRRFGIQLAARYTIIHGPAQGTISTTKFWQAGRISALQRTRSDLQVIEQTDVYSSKLLTLTSRKFRIQLYSSRFWRSDV
jgi:hypothetical protein